MMKDAFGIKSTSILANERTPLLAGPPVPVIPEDVDSEDLPTPSSTIYDGYDGEVRHAHVTNFTRYVEECKILGKYTMPVYVYVGSLVETLGVSNNSCQRAEHTS